MLSEAPSHRPPDVTGLLRGLVERIPEAQSALLLSSDGLKKAHCGLQVDEADHLAAIASGLFSLARSVGTRFGPSGKSGVRQVVAELDDGLLYVSTAGSGAVLAVMAGQGADAGVLGHAMSTLVTDMQPYLSTPPRRLPPGGTKEEAAARSSTMGAAILLPVL